MITSAQCESIHAEFNRLTKQDHRFTISCFFTWEMYLSRGYTVDDLKLVTGYIWSRIKDGKRQKEAFRFSTLIGRLDNFEEERSLAQSAQTLAQKCANEVRMSRGKAQALRATGRPGTTPEQPVMSAGEVLEQHQIMAKLLKGAREAL